MQKGKKGYLIVCSNYNKDATGGLFLEIEANPKVPRMLIQDFPEKVDPYNFTEEQLEIALKSENK